MSLGPLRMWRLALALAPTMLAAPALAAQAHAPPAGEGQAFVTGMAADPSRCNLGVARHFALEDVVRDHAALAGQCVAVRGWWLGSGLFLRADDAVSPGALYESGFAPGRIGLYGRAALLRAAPRGRATIATAVGIVSRCEAYHADPGVMVMGYCHNLLAGPILALAQIRKERPDDRLGALSACPQSRGALANARGAAWAPAPDARAEHRALRARLGVAMPDAPTMVLFHVDSAHHTRWEGSVVAARGEDGRWSVDRIGEESSQLLTIRARVEPRTERLLSAAEGRRLDALLADRCLYAEPDRQAPRDPGSGPTFFAMHVVTPARSRTVAWSGRSLGVTGAVADLVLGRGGDDE